MRPEQLPPPRFRTAGGSVERLMLPTYGYPTNTPLYGRRAGRSACGAPQGGSADEPAHFLKISGASIMGTIMCMAATFLPRFQHSALHALVHWKCALEPGAANGLLNTISASPATPVAHSPWTRKPLRARCR